MVATSLRTQAIIESIFAPADRSIVTDILVNECADNLTSFRNSTEYDLERIRLAVLKLSDGNTETLQYWIERSKEDRRDTLSAADFGTTVSHIVWSNQLLFGT